MIPHSYNNKNSNSMFQLEIVDSYHRRVCPLAGHMGGESCVAVDPYQGYYLRISLASHDESLVDPDRVYLCYLNLDDAYIGHRQVLSPRRGHVEVGLPSYAEHGICVGTQEEIKFQDGKLIALPAVSNADDCHQFDPTRVHLGKVTLKVYEGVRSHYQTAFGNAMGHGDEAYQPGHFVMTQTLHCCGAPETSKAFLSDTEADMLTKVLNKRGFQGQHPRDPREPQSMKKRRTEQGCIAMHHLPPPADHAINMAMAMNLNMNMNQGTVGMEM